jgi:beta-lactamase regulating signal transducer with metallopeptidase domain
MSAPALAALSLLAKATLLFAAAGCASLALHRASAAARHLAWTLAVAGALALPLVSLAVPGWTLPVLPPRAEASVATLPPVQASAPSAAASSQPDGTRAADGWTSEPRASGSAGRTAAPDAGAKSVAGSFVAGWSGDWTSLLFAAWMVGAGLALVRMAAGAWALRRIGRAALPLDGGEWRALVRDLGWMLDLDRPVRLLAAPDAAMPMTWGIFRPVVLLPAAAAEWSEERRRIVLLHELAHVARRDCLTQWLAGLACALYWFHPAAWHAARRLRVERERACDDRVLAAGTRGADYAAHLLEVARAFRAPALAAALSVPMARPSQLEGRLLAVLNGVRRPTLTRRAGVLAALATAGLVLPLAAMRPGPRPAAPAAPEANPAEAVRPPAERTRDAAPPAAAPARQGQVVERTVAARPGEWLSLDLETGAEVTIEPWDRDEVWMRARLGGSDWRWSRVSAERGDGGVRVRSWQTGERGSYSTSHAIELRVPRRFNVRLSSAGGGVAITGLTGTFRGNTGGGELTLSRLSGSADLTTGGGMVRVSDSELSGRVRTGGGGIRLERVRGGLRGWSGSELTSWTVGGDGATVHVRDTQGGGDVLIEPGHGAPAVRVHASGDGATVDYGSGYVTARGGSTTVHTREAAEARAEAARARAEASSSSSSDASGFAYATGGEDERIAAMDAMVESAPAEAAAAALARFAFEDPSPRVQRASVAALERIAGDDDAAVRALARIAREHPSRSVRRAAGDALARCECDTSTRALREISRGDSDPELRRAAARALERRGEGRARH